MADQGERVVAARGDDLDGLAIRKGASQVAQVAIDADGQRGLGQSGTDGGRGVGAGRAVGKLQRVAVREGDLHARRMLAARLAGPACVIDVT